MTAVLEIDVPGRGLHEITTEVSRCVEDATVSDGVCVIFIQHTSASLTIQENADPSARRDLEHWLERTIREDDPSWTHVSEGPDDMPAHVRAMLTDVSLSIPVLAGRLTLGTWQGIYLCEHRRGTHQRRVAVTVIGSC
ncbi:MAG: YjbQ family protein [Planctomycetes bacterium]|jgi:secondary thiamine-phosphate synthase enzyme|nr:YjbQ family protein [Planctomycetota bacterium]MCP4839273.1 YjbQ family protein [Planctomycetota bacterium]